MMNLYSVDTRDFHIATDEKDYKLDLSKIDNYVERFYFTAEEVKSLLVRLLLESGGNCEWRMLSFDIDGARNWELKYIRIYRKSKGLLVCTCSGKLENTRIHNKQFWKSSVNQEYLYAH